MNAEERLEERLRGLRPVALRGEVVTRVAATLEEERWTIGDRIVAAWTGLGAMAAAVLVVAIVWQVAVIPVPTEATAEEMMAQKRMAVEVERLLAGR